MRNCQVTVFTPTYNRRYTLQRLYESLRKQTIKPMEWIIIDDGSSDQTFELIAPWIEVETSFQIIYLRVKNGGKHRAINKASDLARGDLFFIVDSDDYLTEDAIEKIIKWEQTIQGKSGYAGVSGNKGVSDNQLIGHTFKGDYIDATSLEREKYHIEGDKAEVFYTSVLKQYKFPEIEGETFITEAVVWFAIAADDLKIRWFNDIIYIANYLEDGLTKRAHELVKNNPKGTKLTQTLYQKYYNQFTLKEKTIAINHVKQLLITGELEDALAYVNQLMPRLKVQKDIQLLMAQLSLYHGDNEIAKSILQALTMTDSSATKVHLQLAKLLEKEKNIKGAVYHYQKALLYLDSTAAQEVMFKLQESYHIPKDKLERMSLERAKQYYEKGEFEEAKYCILKNPLIEESYQLELYYYWSQPVYNQQLLQIILNLQEDDMDSDYVLGHLSFNQGHYEQSLAHLVQIPPQQLSPLTVHRLAKLLTFRGNHQLSRNYQQTYEMIALQLKQGRKLYYLEETSSEVSKFRKDVNMMFKSQGLKSLQDAFAAGLSSFSIFDIICFQYPFIDSEKVIFEMCANLNTKIVLVIHDLLGGEEETKCFNQATYFILTQDQLASKLLNYPCLAQMKTVELLDYIVSEEQYKQITAETLSTRVIYLHQGETPLLLSDDYEFQLNVYGKPLEGKNVCYQGAISFEESPLSLDGSFGLLDRDTNQTSYEVSMYLLTRRPMIAFKDSPVADFILKHSIGIVIEDLSDFDGMLQQLSVSEYEQMIQNLTRYSQAVYQGHYFKQIFTSILNEL